MWAGHIVYRIAGIFRGYKCSWFLQKSAIPQIHENLSKSISAKMFALEIYPLSGPYEPGELKVKWGGAPLQTFNSSYEARWIPSVYILNLYTQVANWFAWLWSSTLLLTLKQYVARDFASTNTRRINYFAIALTCRLFHLCIFLLFISENVKSSPTAEQKGNFPLPDPPPASQGEGPFLFFAPPPKKFSHGPWYNTVSNWSP